MLVPVLQAAAKD